MSIERILADTYALRSAAVEALHDIQSAYEDHAALWEGRYGDKDALARCQRAIVDVLRKAQSDIAAIPVIRSGE